MFRASSATTKNLVQLCSLYFIFYVITGITVKYFLGKPELGFPGLKEVEFLVYSTGGSFIITLGIIIWKKWYKFESHQHFKFLGVNVPFEFLYIIPSGICTAVVIPTTTLMYSLPISVMVAMIIMRGAVIIISRIVDTILIAQGILHKKVYAEENVAVVFAILAVSVNIFWAPAGSFDFVHSVPAMTILGSYILAYMFRIYIMNYYRHTIPANIKRDNRAFFAVEQLTATVVSVIVAYVIFKSTSWFNWTAPLIQDYRNAFTAAPSVWPWAIVAGFVYGLVAFFSVFIFMFKGRTATFTGLVNRLTSLLAGTTATLLCWFCMKGKCPKLTDWVSLALILIAVIFLTRAEKRRAAELIKTHEIEAK